MTQFEQMLLDKGYIKHILNCKTMKFELSEGHTISSMVNLNHVYFHESDTTALQKIASGKSITEEDFTKEDRRGEICFGLNEHGHPPTLIWPRPRIQVKRIQDGKIFIYNEVWDDSMNVVLKEIPHEEILKAMYDKSIIFKIDLTTKGK
jgi:hypothetical protein